MTFEKWKKIESLVIFIRNGGWKDLNLRKHEGLNPQLGINYDGFCGAAAVRSGAGAALRLPRSLRTSDAGNAWPIAVGLAPNAEGSAGNPSDPVAFATLVRLGDSFYVLHSWR